MGEWISVKDRLPEKGQSVLVVDGKNFFVGKLADLHPIEIVKGRAVVKLPRFRWSNGGSIAEGFRAEWLPIPDPPKADK